MAPRTESADIQVVAVGGAVYVSGSAAGAKVVTAGGEVVAQVPGVCEVRNEVGVGSDRQW